MCLASISLPAANSAMRVTSKDAHRYQDGKYRNASITAWISPGLDNAGWLKCFAVQNLRLLLPVVILLSLIRWNTADWSEQTLVVKPDHPFQWGHLHRRLYLPWASMVNQSSLVKSIDSFCQRIVIGVTRGASRGFSADLSQSMGITDW